MPDSNAPPALPQVSDRYQTETILGQGGMGVVYKAYDIVTKRHVAVKTMWGDVEPGAIELFEREWSILARLSHPNIVDILDTGEFHEPTGQRKPYFVMPLLPGNTLDQIIKNESQRLTVDRVVEIMCQACKGLQAAHDQNLVHRDLKPSNIFVMDDDTAKIIDFGVAHLADSRSITGIKGTLQYMAPEQTDMSSPVSARSDIFSLAVVCYEAFTGRKPFARRTEADTIDAIRTYIPPPASEINNAVNNLLSRTVHKAMAKQPWHRFSSAKEFSETLQKAMRNEPIDRFDRAKIQPRIERVKKAFSEGDNQFAMEILTELESEGHIDPDMTVLRIQIEQSVRQRSIRQLLESARTRMQGDEHPLALQKLGEILAIDPNNADALSLRSQIERQRGEKQIEGWFRLVEEHRGNHLFSQAKQGLQEILKIDSSNTKARTMLAEIDQTEQELNKFREEKQRLYEGALASYQNGEISTALSKLERGLDLSRRPNAKTLTTELDAKYQSFYNQVRSERDAARNAYAEGRKSLEDKNTARALEICEEFLQKHPNDPMFQALKLEAEEMQRQEQSAAIAEVDRRAEAEPDLDKKFNIIKDAGDRFPNEPHFKTSLKLIRDRRDLVNSIVARARHYEERGQFADATNQWDILRNIYPVYPGLDFEMERLTRGREEHMHAEAKARWMERIDGHFAAGEYAKAREVIKEGLLDFPNDKELEGLESLAEQGIRRSGEANILLAQGRELCAARNHAEGVEALRKAERLDPRNTTTRVTLLSSLVEYARELISKDWHSAEPLIQEATALNAEDPVVRSLNSLLESHRRQESISNILVEARGLQAADDLSGALKKVEEGLAEYPNEVRLAQLHNTLRAAAAASSSRTDTTTVKPASVAPKVDAQRPVVEPSKEEAKLEAPLDFAATSFQPAEPKKKFKPEAESAGKVVAPPVPPPPIAAKRPPPPEKAAPSPAGLTAGGKKPLWMVVAGAGAVVILGSILYSLVHHKGPTTDLGKGAAVETGTAIVKVNLTADQPGAAFKVDGVRVSTPASLKAGDHIGEASLDGFSSDNHAFTVSNSATTPVTVAFTLRPLLPELRFSSGISSGSFIFDDGTPADLQEGAFTKSDIPMGKHHVRVMDGRREVFSFAFDASPKQMVKVTSPLGGEGGSGVVISSLSGAAQVYATPGLKGGMSGQALQPVPAEGLSIPAANPPQRISVSDGNGAVRELTPDSSTLPVLTVLLNGGVERVPVTITSNVPDATVSIDGHALNRKMVNGSRFINLGAGAFNVVVTADGYQPGSAQKLVVKAGDRPKHLDFQLTPVLHLASLGLSGAPPEAAIFVDDVRAGTVNAGGSFTKDVNPGVHQIVVRKSGLEEYRQSHEFKAGESFKLAVQMHAATGGMSFHVSPANAKITVRKDTEIYTPANGQTEQLAPGSYIVTAAADEFKAKTETVQLEVGKPVTIDWTLQAAPHEAEAPVSSVPFANPKAWTKEGGWMVHTGPGLSIYTGSGTHVVDILKRKNKLGFGSKRIVFWADFTSKGNYTQYGLDGRNLYRTVVVDGKPSQETKLPFGQDNGEVIRMTIDVSADSFTIKNRAGNVVDSIRKTGVGRFGFVDDATVNVNQ